jgi:signal transduction histidine kinase
VGMRERLLPYNGELHLEGAPGAGTVARVVMPKA